MLPLGTDRQLADTPAGVQIGQKRVLAAGPVVVVRTPELKLIADHDGDGVQLYDLAQDPGEHHNVAAERSDDLAAMRQLLATWRAHLAAPPASTSEALDAKTAKEVKALGYLGD